MSARARGGPGTVADARAMAAAVSPAARAPPSSAVAKNPHDEPIRARTPTPADSDCSSDSIVWLRASRLWRRETTTRASAYSAPAASAPSTAATAGSNMAGRLLTVMFHDAPGEKSVEGGRANVEHYGYLRSATTWRARTAASARLARPVRSAMRSPSSVVRLPG